jgi:hypothetical protein
VKQRGKDRDAFSLYHRAGDPELGQLIKDIGEHSETGKQGHQQEPSRPGLGRGRLRSVRGEFVSHEGFHSGASESAGRRTVGTGLSVTVSGFRVDEVNGKTGGQGIPSHRLSEYFLQH